MRGLIKEIYHFLTLRLLFPWQYRRYSKGKLKEKKVVFIEANLPKLSNSLELLYRELQKTQEYELCVHCLREIYSDRAAYIRQALGCLKDMADAETIFLCEGSRLVSCISPREGTTIVQVWHGCGAFKKFGFSTAELLFGGSRRENLCYSYYKNYDLVTVSSPEVVWAYEEAMNLEKNSGIVQPLGISRTDIFFCEEWKKEAEARVREKIPQVLGKKILLYAPTFRGSVGKAKAPDALDIGQLRERLGEEYFLLIKHHPLVKVRPVLEKSLKDFAADVTELLSIEELLFVSDLCISDYSSLIFEYSLFQRPMVFFAYDLEEYGDWRGFYYDYEELTPGPVVQKTEEVIHYIENLETEFDQRKVQAFREKFMGACDGHSTERLLSKVMERRM